MVLRKINPAADQQPSQSSQPARAIDGQLASLSATLRDVRDKVSRTPTDSKSNTGPAPSEASYQQSYQESYQESYHDEDPQVADDYSYVPAQDPPEYTAAPPVYNPSDNAIPKNQRRKRWFTSLCFFFCAIMLCILLILTQYASRSDNKSRYNQPILHPPHPVPFVPVPSDVPAPNPNRSLIRHETSQSISGTYTLHDLIDFSTSSGSISVTIQLSDDDILNPRSTLSPTLKLSAKSGSINLNFKSPRFTNVPLKHTVILTTVSGSCNARIVHGLSTSVSTSSGSCSLNIYPSASHGNESYLTTTSKSGSQSIVVYDPEGTAGSKLDGFKADITTMGSASLNLKYPRTWEGTVHASSGGSGSVHVSGRDVEVVDLGRREVHGMRGKGSRTELVGSGSGSINFYAG